MTNKTNATQTNKYIGNNQNKSNQEPVSKSTKANEVNPMDPKAYSNCPVSIIRM